MAVAPDSSAMNWRNFAIMAASLRSGDEGYLKMTCDKKEAPARLARGLPVCPGLRHNPEHRQHKLW